MQSSPSCNPFLPATDFRQHLSIRVATGERARLLWGRRRRCLCEHRRRLRGPGHHLAHTHRQAAVEPADGLVHHNGTDTIFFVSGGQTLWRTSESHPGWRAVLRAPSARPMRSTSVPRLCERIGTRQRRSGRPLVQDNRRRDHLAGSEPAGGVVPFRYGTRTACEPV
jgi:hypothetical protein